MSGEPESGARRDAAPLVHDFIYPLIGHANGFSELTLREAARLEELLEQPDALAACELEGGPSFTSVVVDYDVDRICFRPSEADPVLVVDPDAVLALTVSAKCLEVSAISVRSSRVNGFSSL